MQLVKANGEDVIDFDKILPARLVGLAERRLNHKRLDCIILDFGLSKRLWIQSTPTDLDDEFEIDILTFCLTDSPIQNEKEVDIEDVVIQRVERITTDYENQKITVGIRLVADGKPLDIYGGDVLASLAVYGWGFPAIDQQRGYPLKEYEFEPWS